MPVSIPDFWNLLVASRLAASSSLPKLQDQFSQVKGADTQGNSTTLAQWLISQGVLSKYQAKVLLAGHAGPFIYGEYTVYDRLSSGRLQGAFRAIHPPTRVRVMLSFHSGGAVQNTQWWSILVDQIGKFSQAVHPNLRGSTIWSIWVNSNSLLRKNCKAKAPASGWRKGRSRGGLPAG